MKEKWLFLENKYKIIIIVMIVLILAILVGLLLFLSDSDIEEEVVYNPIEVVLEEDENEIEIEESNENETILQSQAIGLYYSRITNINDKSSAVIYYNVEIGAGDDKFESLVQANRDTIFYDMEKERKMYPSDLSVNDIVIVYARGSMIAGNLEAVAICRGEDTSLRYGEIKNNQLYSNDGIYLIELQDTKDRLLISKGVEIKEGLLDSYVLNINELVIGTKILYEYDPDNIILTDQGNVYNCKRAVKLNSVINS